MPGSALEAVPLPGWLTRRLMRVFLRDVHHYLYDATIEPRPGERFQVRRDVLCDGLNAAGWPVERPKGTMFVWARIPLPYRHMGSLEFSKLLLKEAKVAVSPG